MKRTFIAFGLSLLSAAINLPLRAADWPSQTIRIIAPYPPGGSTDSVARVLSDYAASKLGVSVIVENRPGGGSTIGTTAVARAAPDGYTLLLGGLVTHVIAPKMVGDAAPNPLGAFENIGFIGGAPTCMVVSKNSSIKSIADLSKAYGDFTFGTVGVGSLGHLIGSQVATDAHVKMIHVPYTGLDSLQDVMAGRIDAVFLAWPSVQGLVASGELRLIGCSTEHRLKSQPNVATLKEQGVDAVVDSWFSIAAPKGLPQPIAERLNGLLRDFVTDATVLKRLENDVFEPKALSRDDFNTYIVQQIALWSPRIEKAVKK
jgi:tripartite-type tricarboxylate transporter receptor subunit TctC